MAQGYSYIACTSQGAPYLEVHRVVGDTITTVELPELTTITGGMRAIAWSPDSKYLLVGVNGSSSAVRLRCLKRVGFDLFEEIPLTSFIGWPTSSRAVNKIVWHPSGDYVFLATTTGIYQLNVDRDLDTFTIDSSTPWNGNTNNIDDIAVTADGSVVAAVSTGVASVYNFTFSAGVATATTNGNTLAGMRTVDLAPDGSWGLVGGTTTNHQLKRATNNMTTFANATPMPAGLSIARITPGGGHVVLGCTQTPWVRVYANLNGSLAYGWDNATGANSVDISFCSFDHTRFVVARQNASATNGRIGVFEIAYERATLTLLEVIGEINSSYLGCSWSGLISADLASWVYNHSVARLGNLGDHTLKALFVSPDFTFDPADATLAEAVGDNEAVGSNWPAGGVVLSGVGFVQGDGNEAGFAFDFPSTSLTSPGSFVVSGLLVYDDDDPDDAPLLYLPFDTEQTLSQYDQLELNLLTGHVLTFAPG